jgi:xanthine dehydrogenase YagT iron-sulfur-binding subunit
MLDEADAGWPSAVTVRDPPDAPALSPPDIRERMSGNLCRCGAYVNIVAAITDVAGAAGLGASPHDGALPSPHDGALP